MAQHHNSLWDTASIQGQRSEEVTRAVGEGKRLPASLIQQRKGLIWSQITHEAEELLHQVNLATGRARDSRGAHFHVWKAKPSADIVWRLGYFLLGMEKALTLTKNKGREKLRDEFFAVARTDFYNLVAETSVSFLDPYSDWVECSKPYGSCSRVLGTARVDKAKQAEELR
jgi:hypothetical protein